MLGGAWRGSVESGVGKSDEGVEEEDLDEDYSRALHSIVCVCRNWQHHSCCVKCCVKCTGDCLSHDSSSRHSLRHILYTIRTCICSNLFTFYVRMPMLISL